MEWGSGLRWTCDCWSGSPPRREFQQRNCVQETHWRKPSVEPAPLRLGEPRSDIPPSGWHLVQSVSHQQGTDQACADQETSHQGMNDARPGISMKACVTRLVGKTGLISGATGTIDDIDCAMAH